MRCQIALVLFVQVLVSISAQGRNKRGILGSWVNPSDTAQIVLSNGYPAEVHEVTTQDGYILSLYRIPYGKNGKSSETRPPILVQHGVICDSDCWVISTPEKGLAYVLADAGFDVWIGNNRGTTYGLKHVNLTTSDEAFWNFSFDEMGNYDLPAMIDFILGNTGSSKVAYVAHSQGTTQFFAMAALRPEYNEKISVFGAMAPVAFLNGTEGAIRILSKGATELSWFMKTFHVYHVLGQNIMTNAITHFMCRPSAWFRNVCDDLIQVFTGFDSPQLNQTLLEIAVQHSPAGASMKQLLHFAQLCDNSGTFSRYDYGSSKNMDVYKKSTAPEYDLSKLTTPTILQFAENDFIARPSNALEISRKIGSKNVRLLQISNSNFNHMDFMWAKDVVTLAYNDLITNLKLFMN